MLTMNRNAKIDIAESADINLSTNKKKKKKKKKKGDISLKQKERDSILEKFMGLNNIK